MPRVIGKAAVLGAGVMGAQIAAHLANVGIPSLLLDIVPKELTPDEEKKGLTLASPAVRNRLASGAIQRLTQLKPSPIFSKDVLELITPGNLEDDLAKLAGVDWIVEAVVENLTVKQDLWKRVAAHWTPGTVVSSNTSGITIAGMVAHTPAEFRRHFLGTHFFNPPRYMKLLELIPTPETDPAVLEYVKEFGERVLGKGAVIAKDTPNFIGNRVGTYGMMVTLHVMAEQGMTVDEVDALTGPVLGRPKSATFRTTDIVGLDTFCHVADNCKASISDPDEAAVFTIPETLREMVKRGWLGQKSGQGFFKKVGDEILTLDLKSMEYGPRKRASFPSLDAAKPMPNLADRMQTLVYADDRAGKFLWEVMKRTLVYAAEKVGEIADDLVSIDNALKWGFNWEMGPFEAWDAIGVGKSVARMEAEGVRVPAFVKEAAARGGFFRREGGDAWFLVKGGDYAPVAKNPRIIDVDALKAAGKVVKAKKGATLVDIGDGVLLLEMHSPKNAMGTDVILMMRSAHEELEKGDWVGLVIGSQAENFCVGANVMMMLAEAQDEEWEDIDFMVRQGHAATMALKYGSKPVVSAPYGLALGGGVELTLFAHRVVAAAETYMGQVEPGVGLIPGMGGNKELLIRALENVPKSVGQMGGPPLDLQPLVNKVFEVIGTAKVATSAREAVEYGMLRKTDRIVANRDHLLYEAKQAVLDLAAQGFRAMQPARIPVAGPEGRAVLELGLYNMRQSGWISKHDALIGKKLAYVLTGGEVPSGTMVTEQYLLDLEREAFVSLLKEKKTQERMAYILKHGKPLRN